MKWRDQLSGDEFEPEAIRTNREEPRDNWTDEEPYDRVYVKEAIDDCGEHWGLSEGRWYPIEPVATESYMFIVSGDQHRGGDRYTRHCMEMRATSAEAAIKLTRGFRPNVNWNYAVVVLDTEKAHA